MQLILRASRLYPKAEHDWLLRAHGALERAHVKWRCSAQETDELITVLNGPVAEHRARRGPEGRGGGFPAAEVGRDDLGILIEHGRKHAVFFCHDSWMHSQGQAQAIGLNLSATAQVADDGGLPCPKSQARLAN